MTHRPGRPEKKNKKGGEPGLKMRGHVTGRGKAHRGKKRDEEPTSKPSKVLGPGPTGLGD